MKENKPGEAYMTAIEHNVFSSKGSSNRHWYQWLEILDKNELENAEDISRI